MNMCSYRKLLLLSLPLVVVACGSREGPPGAFGQVTSVVFVINPVINQGSTTTVAIGTERSGLEIHVDKAGTTTTNSTGLALLEDLPTGSNLLELAAGEATLEVVAEKELYDVVLSVTSAGVVHVVPPIRYPIGGNVIEVPAGSDLGALAEDDAILFLEKGTYPGGIEIRGEGVLIFGAWDPLEGPLSVIEGDLTALGGNGRLRGVHVEGTLISNANGFSAAFCRLGSANITGNSVTLIRNIVEDPAARVPSSNAVLVDNEGLPAQ